MAQYNSYAGYVIYFRSQSEYNFAVAVAGGNIIDIAPATAASMFGMTFPQPAGPLDPVKGMYSTSYSFTEPGSLIGHPGPSGIRLSPSANNVLIPGQSGLPSTPVGPDMLLIWEGTITLIGGEIGPNPDPEIKIPRRRWIGGLELTPLGEGGTGGNSQIGCRDSSRTLDGIGYPVRGVNTNGQWRRTPDEYIPAYNPRSSWERFYIRPRVIGLTNFGFWRAFGTVNPTTGPGISLENDGSLGIYNLTSSSSGTLLGKSSVLPLMFWYLIDVIYIFNDGITGQGFIVVYINHTLVFQTNVAAASGGLGANQRHLASGIGTRWSATGDTQIEMDIDDWICADVPVDDLGNITLESIDWFMGSHVRKHFAVSAVLTNYAGQFPSLDQGVSPENQSNSAITSSTSGASLIALTDIDDLQQVNGQSLGAVALVVGAFTSNVLNTNGQIGYSVKGSAAVLSVAEETSAGSSISAAYLPSDLTLPEAIAPVSIAKTKSLDANLNTIRFVQAAVEYIGAWGPEDDPNTVQFNRINLLHNCQYANTLWGYAGSVPDAPVYSVGGTYVGNGLFQNLTLPAPVHFLWIRALTGGSAGVKWYATGLGGNRGGTERCVPNYPVRVWVDELGQARFRVVGTDAEVNANGVTYQYIAFCDPGMRFNLCGVYNIPNGVSSRVLTLADTNFLSQFTFIQKQVVNNASTTRGLAIKGPGNAGNTGRYVDGTAVTNFGILGVGTFTTLGDINFSQVEQTVYSLWRTTDIICGPVGVQTTSYVGNATNPRVITLSPLTGRYPLFALVVPETGAVAVMRDPSHVGANSCGVTNLSNTTSGIVDGGIDTITVSSGLNTNGITYNVFVIPGDAFGWNNGEFYPPNCISPNELWPQPEPPIILPGINVIGEGGLILGGDPSKLLLKDVSGIYTLIEDKPNDTMYDRQTNVSSVNLKIPNPTAKGGYIGG